MISAVLYNVAEFKPSIKTTRCKNCEVDDVTGNLPWVQKPIYSGEPRFVLHDSTAFGGGLRHITLCESCFKQQIELLKETIKQWEGLLK